MLERFGRAIFRYRWLTLVAAALFLTVSVYFFVRGGELTTGSIKGIESNDAQEEVSEVLGHPAATTFVILFRSDVLDPSGADFKNDVKETVAPLRRDPRVQTVVTAADAPSLMAAHLINKEKKTELALITLHGDTRQALQNYPAVRAEILSRRLTVECTGELPYVNGLDRTLEEDARKAEVLSLPLAVFVLLGVFGTLVAALLPAGIGGLAVIGGIAIILVTSRFFDVAQYTVNVCSVIGLGVAIDYSLFIVSRYREELAQGRSYPDALARAVATAGEVVLFSGMAVCTGLSGLFFFRGSYLLPMGMGGAIVVALSVIFALTFLPALLAVLGPKIHAGRVPLPSLGRSEGMWHRMATAVMKRPVMTLLPTLAVLLIMGVPFFHIRLAGADVRVIATTVEARHAYEDLKAAFPEDALKGQAILVAVRFPTTPTLTKERVDALYDYSRRIATLPHVLKVQSIVDLPADIPDKQGYEQILLHPAQGYAHLVDLAKDQYIGGHVALLYVLLKVLPETDEARTVVKAIRANRQVGDGTLVVGGETAQDVDVTAYIIRLAPRAIGWVVGATLIILFFLLGSVVLPIKAVVMNFVSIVGSFGLIVWVFQDGHLWIHTPRPLEPSLPVLLFCVIFGLSMDYEVLMLSRIRESYERTGDNTHAVAEGLEKTAGLITSAALIMVFVFGAFTLARVVQMQSMGFGMTVAVTMDATLVRVLLVPATMRLFGDANWWAPKCLVRLREALNPRDKSV